MAGTRRASLGARRIFDLGEREERETPAKPVTSLSEVAARVDTPNQWNGSPFAVTWPDVGRWTEEINAAAKAARVDARVLAAIVMMETQGIHERDGRVLEVDDGYGDGPAVGLTQVKPRRWGWLCPNCDPYTPAGNLLLAARLLAHFREEEGDDLDRIMRRWFPALDPNGTTPHRYMATFWGLMGELGYAA